MLLVRGFAELVVDCASVMLIPETPYKGSEIFVIAQFISLQFQSFQSMHKLGVSVTLVGTL